MSIPTVKTKKGFTLVELLVSVGIFLMIGLTVANFGRDIFAINTSLQNNLGAQLDGRNVIRKLMAELRSSSPSSLGGYPIEQAGTSTLIFYTNIDSSVNKERLRYFLSGTTLMRGVIKPSGSPLTYNAGSETFSTIARNIVNGTSTAIFEYFNGNYAGTSTPLAQPVTTSQVRLIRATIIIDADPNKSPQPITITSQAMIRNLKDNF